LSSGAARHTEILPSGAAVFEWRRPTYRNITKWRRRFWVAPPYIPNYYQVAPLALPAPLFVKYFYSLSLIRKVYKIGGGGGGWWRLCHI